MSEKISPRGLKRRISHLGKWSLLGVLLWCGSAALSAPAEAKSAMACGVQITNARGVSLTEVDADEAFYAEVTWVGDQKLNSDIKRVEVYSQGDLFGTSNKVTGALKFPPDSIVISSGFYEFEDAPEAGAFMVSVVGKLTRTDGSSVSCSKVLWVR